jgi:hypothetical protein
VVTTLLYNAGKGAPEEKDAELTKLSVASVPSLTSSPALVLSTQQQHRCLIYIVDLYGLLCFDPVSQVSTILARLLFTGWHLSGYIE